MSRRASRGNRLEYEDDESDSGDIPDVLPTQEDRYEVFMPAVQALVNALGGFEEVQNAKGEYVIMYRPGDSVLAVLKDLKKLWRKDDTDDERTVARCMAKAGLMKELIALVRECTARGDWGRKVALMSFDLIAALTWPIDVAAELKEAEDDPEGPPADYGSLIQYQLEYKALLLQGEVLRYLLTLLLPSFANSRDEKEARVISLGLHVVRNLLAIKDLSVSDTAASSESLELSTLQSALIEQLNKFTYLELFLTLASEATKSEFSSFNMLLLDMVHLIVRSVRLQDLAMDQKRAPMDSLRELLDQESRERMRNSKSRSNTTRHSRFGTTIAVRAPTQRLVLHSQRAITERTGKLLDAIKKTRKPPTKQSDDPTSKLTPEVITILQKFCRDFLDPFNDYFETVLSDIQHERQKVRPADAARALFVARFLMEYLLILRQKAIVKADAVAKGTPDAEAPIIVVDQELPLTLVAVMVEFDTVRWVVARMRMAMDNRPVSFKELQAATDCFTQTLLILDAIVHASDEEDKEVAETLQNQIYYNGDILDSAIELFTLWKPTHKEMLVSFMDCSIHFAYVLLRMLEKFSKSKSFLFVRKRARAKRTRKPLPKDDSKGEAPIPEEYINEDEEALEDEADDGPSYAEHAFTFTAFEKRFAQEAVSKWLLTYLARYETLNADQLKRVVNLMHRQAIKAQAEGLYFTVPALHLFQSLLDDKDMLPKGDGARDLVHLITFILRKFFKKVDQDPWVIIEALLPKGRGQWQHLSSLPHDDDVLSARIPEKLSAQELEFVKKNKLSWSQQMGVVVSLLVTAGRAPWINEIISALEVALAARQEVVLRMDGDKDAAEDSDAEVPVRNLGVPSKEAIEKFERLDFMPSDGLRPAVTGDQHIKLMLRLLHFEKADEEADELEWYLPASVVPSVLETSIGAMNQFLLDPPSVEAPSKLLRSKRRQRVERDSVSGDESESGERVPRRRRVRKAAEVQVFKSAAFIYDTDDDEDADAAFFAREEKLRLEMQLLAAAQGNMMRQTGTKKRKRKDKETAPASAEVEDEDEAMGPEGDTSDPVVMDSDDEELPPAIRRRSVAHMETPDSDAESGGSGTESDAKHGTPTTGARADPDEESAAGTPVRTTQKPRSRARILDSDDDE